MTAQRLSPRRVAWRTGPGTTSARGQKDFRYGGRTCMAISAGERVFVDTKVLVHASAISSPLHQAADRELQAVRGAQAELWTSRQVLREYVAVLSRPQSFSH